MLLGIGPVSDALMEKSKGDAEDQEDNVVEDGDADEDEGNGILETEWLCDMCYYHYAPSAAALDDHKRKKHDTEPFLCRWPGCPTACSDADSLEEHVRLIHELRMWFCQGRDCYRRFATEDEILEHMDLAHPEEDLEEPRLIEKRFRTFKAADLESERVQYLKRFHDSYPDVESQHERRAGFYAAYYSPTARSYFRQRGLLNQQDNEGSDWCRSVDAIYLKRANTQTRPNANYNLGRLTRAWHWWVCFLNQEEGSRLDKYIDNAVLGWCEISHKCHRPWCYVFSHLEFVRTRTVCWITSMLIIAQVRTPNNMDRSVCKNSTRRDYGGCQAENSLHSHDPCLLDLELGDSFDYDLPPAMRAIRAGARSLKRKRSQIVRIRLPKTRKESFENHDESDSPDETQGFLCRKGCGRSNKTYNSRLRHEHKCDSTDKTHELRCRKGCGRIYTYIDRRNRHEHKCGQPKTFLCRYGCGRTYENARNRNRHEVKCEKRPKRNSDEETDLFPCRKGCGKDFVRRGTALTHEETCGSLQGK